MGDRSRIGRPQITIPRENRQIRPQNLQKRFRNTIKTLLQLLNDEYILIVYVVCALTPQSRLRGAGFRARRPYI